MGNERGLVSRLRAPFRRQQQATETHALRDLAVIHSELRRARRFRLPLAVITFRLYSPSDEALLPKFANRLQTDLREFDYLVVDPVRGQFSIWMFGTPREGAHCTLVRMQGLGEMSSLIAKCLVGVAVFPQDGMTYDALIDHALGQSPALEPRPESANDGRVAWQPSVHGANRQSTS